MTSENGFHVDTCTGLMTELPQMLRATNKCGCGERRSPVTVTARDGVYYDPYDVQINADPYLAFRGLREEAPLYYNEQRDFYALSRCAELSPASTVCGWEAMPAVRG